MHLLIEIQVQGRDRPTLSYRMNNPRGNRLNRLRAPQFLFSCIPPPVEIGPIFDGVNCHIFIIPIQKLAFLVKKLAQKVWLVVRYSRLKCEISILTSNIERIELYTMHFSNIFQDVLLARQAARRPE